MFCFNSFSTIVPRFNSLTTFRSIVTCSQQGSRSLLASNVNQNSLAASVKPGSLWSLDIIRTIIRNHFPYPRETKRVKTHGYKKRISTPGGRAILMRRILKGRHVLSH